MMTSRKRRPGLVEQLPPVRGRYAENVPLAGTTWFRVGGPAEVMFRPADLDDLTHFLKAKPREVPVTVIGVASNLLVRDGGIEGVVIRLARGFSAIDVEDSTVRAGAMALAVNVALTSRDAGIAGLEFLRGVPGTIGGTLRMNAGAYGREIADVLIGVEAVDPSGRVHALSCRDMGFGYRRSSVPEGWIFTAAKLRGQPGERSEIMARMAKIDVAREESQPLRARTGGSTFLNPEGAQAWELIDKAGCRGLRRGGAMVSEKHCNFLINCCSATAADLEALGEEVRRRVAEATGVTLEWEIRRIGRHAEQRPKETTP